MQLRHLAFLRLLALTPVLFITAWTISSPVALAQSKKAPAQAQSPAAGKKGPVQAQTSTPAKQSLVDVNSADLKTLDTLPGIGPVLAQRIIDGRPYKTLADLEKVKGLAKWRLEDLKDKITFGPATATVRTDLAGKSTNAVAPRTLQGTPSSAVRDTSSKAPPTTSTTAPRAAGKLAPGQKININKATAAELDALPGIGPAKAQAIIAFRTQNGDFKTIEDIQKVRGIKAGSFSKLKDYIKVAD